MRNWRKWLPLASVVGAALLGISPEAWADEAPKIDTGDTAWMLTSTALVLLMTIPAWRCSTPAWCARRTCCRR